MTALDRAKARVAHESPLHGPIVLAELAAANARIAETESHRIYNWDWKSRAEALEKELVVVKSHAEHAEQRFSDAHERAIAAESSLASMKIERDEWRTKAQEKS